MNRQNLPFWGKSVTYAGSRGQKAVYALGCQGCVVVWRMSHREKEKVFPGGERSLYWACRDLMDYLFWGDSPINCLCHSFKPYHLAELQNVEKIRHQTGHADENMTKYQYGTPRHARLLRRGGRSSV